MRYVYSVQNLFSLSINNYSPDNESQPKPGPSQPGAPSATTNSDGLTGVWTESQSQPGLSQPNTSDTEKKKDNHSPDTENQPKTGPSQPRASTATTNSDVINSKLAQGNNNENWSENPGGLVVLWWA